MHLLPLLSTAAVGLVSLGAAPAAEAAKPRDAILLSQVESLTLRGDRQTTHRRVSALPQLKCVSRPSVCDKHRVDLMRCENKGSGYDSEDIQWSCAAQLPPELKLGSTDVICEGYSSPDDPYVLKGSCGVEYRLVLTREGEERWPDLGSGHPDGSEGEGGGAFKYVFFAIFISVVCWILYSAWNESQRNRGGGGGGRAPRRNFGGGGGGGGGWDGGDDDPPPPYPGTRGGGGYTRKTGGSGSRGSSRAGSGGSNWQSSLLSGAAGAAAGYWAGSRNNNYGSTWGRGGAGPSGSRSGSGSGSSGSSSGSSASNSRYESTGFGSTSRR